jgi:Tfp pilus assembly protein PilX
MSRDATAPAGAAVRGRAPAGAAVHDYAPAGPAVRQPPQGEAGSVLILAIVVLLVVSLLTTVTVAAAISTNGSTRRDSNYKNAAEAAEAGLQVALYRINMLNPSASNCVGDAVTTPAASTDLCQSSTYTLGNGATYTYYTSPVLSSSSTCVGADIISSDVNQRCITAIGTANGVVARSQIRASAFAAEPLFPINGMIGLNYVTMSGGAVTSGAAGSNGAVTMSGTASAGSVTLGPAGSFNSTSSVASGPITTLSNPIVLTPVDPGTSNQSSLAACPAREAAGYTTCNDDFRITNGTSNPVVTPYDQAAGNVKWDPSTRSLSLSGNAALTLGGGLYNFCSLTMSGTSVITVAANVQTEVFIDSPSDPGSGCTSGGNLSLSGTATFVNLSQNPLALQIYVYGLSNGTSSITLSGNTDLYGTIYAPQSQITLSGKGRVIGAMAGKSVTITGNGFNWDGRDATLQATTNGLYYRTGWAQCSPTVATGAAPGSGCG